MPSGLHELLTRTFSSVDNLKAEMIAAAYSMFGPGYVWLVRTKPHPAKQMNDHDNQFRILTTYLAGSPLQGAHNRLQPVDMNSQNLAAVQAAGGAKGLTEAEFLRQTQVQNSVGDMGTTSRSRMSTAFGGVDVVPVLCVNTWQHAWMFDFTIDGKMEFLRRWWDLVNWEKVATVAEVNNRKTTSSRYSLPTNFSRY
jgi:Fe-Mn family superoxide dismutase